MTGLLDTPDKGLMHGIIGKSGDVGMAAAGKLQDSVVSESVADISP